jgi:hypothetical protein
MNYFVSYDVFLKNKDNIREYLDNLFVAVPDIIIYFPDSLSKEDRHLIYTQSKGYLFDKLHKVSSEYSIKLWKPLENNINKTEISEEYDNISSEREGEEEEEEEEKEKEEEEEDDDEDYEDYEDYEDCEGKILKLENKINILINKFNIVNITCVFNILLLFYVILLNPIRVIVTKEEHNECNFKMIA